MPKDFPRSARVAERIQQDLSALIRDELRDPRITGPVTVAAVEVSRDLRHARVAVTVLGGDEAAAASAAEALNHAAGYLRSLLARQWSAKRLPRLVFAPDPTFDRGARLSALIEEARAEDRRRGGGS